MSKPCAERRAMIANLSIVEADLARAEHREAVLALLKASAADSADQGPSPSSDTRSRLIPRLRGQPHFLTFLAYDGEKPAGIAICFCGQSHAQGLPLLYISDFFVLPTHRRRGMGHLLLEAIEQKARVLGCCQLVLEVHTDNLPARRLYESAGFAASASPVAVAGTVRLVKPLEPTSG